MEQIIEIRRFKWDNLIVLDACRYDFFSKLYEAYLKGKLIKAISPATCTIEWLKETWNGYYDVTYISANPIVNSAGIPRLGYTAAEHFKRIVDVWNFGWDEELGTVPPQQVNIATVSLPVKKGLIIHYMQPHQPYIGETRITVSIEKPKITHETMSHPMKGGGFYRTAKKIDKKITEGEPSLLKRAYADNLRLVLKWVAELAPQLEGKTVVTSDHGELLTSLGSRHPCGSKKPELKNVPWFEVG